MSGTAAELEAVEAARNGDAAAYGVLVERYQQVAFRTAYLLLRDAQAAEDVAQEAFVRAQASLASFKRERAFRPWLLRIVTNLALNETRRRSRQRNLLGRLGRLARLTEPGPEAGALAREQQDDVLAALATLPLDRRAPVYLHYYLGLPVAEIAAVLDCPEGTVKSRIHRARQDLRTVIERDYPGLLPPGGPHDDA